MAYHGVTSDEELLSAWIHGRSPSTARTYRSVGARLLRALPDGLQAATITQLQAWADSLRGTPNTRATSINVGKSLLRFAHEIGYCGTDHGRFLRAPRAEPAQTHRTLSLAEVRALVEAPESLRDRALLRLLYLTGARISEALALQADELDTTVTLHGKGGKRRQVVIPSTLLSELRSLGHSEGVLFRTKSGRGMTPRDAQRVLEKAAARAGLRCKPSPHWLRHAHATHALTAGAPLHVVQRQLGHASISTTSVYLRAREDQSTVGYLAL